MMGREEEHLGDGGEDNYSGSVSGEGSIIELEARSSRSWQFLLRTFTFPSIS